MIALSNLLISDRFLMFFTKGKPTRDIRFYEHRYPPDYNSYLNTKPIRIEEFDPETKWWDQTGHPCGQDRPPDCGSNVI